MTTRKNQHNGWTVLFIASLVMGWSACTADSDAIKITPEASTLAVGNTLQFTALNKKIPHLQTDRDITAYAGAGEFVRWTSSNPAVATVSNASGTKGLVTAVAAGQTVINAEFVLIFQSVRINQPPTLNVSGSSNSVTVTVTAVPVTLTSIAVTPNTSPCILVGATQPFTATGTFSSGPPGDITTTVAWSSSDTNVATIGAATGVATAAGPGATTITATLAPATPATATLNVDTTEGPLVSIAVAPPDVPFIDAGETQQFTALGTFTCGPTQDITTTVTWSVVSNPVDAVTISNDPGTEGLATTVDPSMSTITATQGVSGTATMNVVGP